MLFTSVSLLNACPAGYLASCQNAFIPIQNSNTDTLWSQHSSLIHLPHCNLWRWHQLPSQQGILLCQHCQSHSLLPYARQCTHSLTPNLIRVTYPPGISDVDISSTVNKVFHLRVIAFLSQEMQGSVLLKRSKISKKVNIHHNSCPHSWLQIYTAKIWPQFATGSLHGH